MSVSLRVAAIALVPIAVIGCTLIGPRNSAEDGVERQPGPGMVILGGDPPNAAVPLTIDFLGSDGSAFDERRVVLKRGDPIAATAFGLPDTVSVRVNGAVCDGTFALVEDQTTHVVLSFPGNNCRVEVASITPR